MYYVAILLIVAGLLLYDDVKYYNFRKHIRNGNPVRIKFHDTLVSGKYYDYIDGMCRVKFTKSGTKFDITVEKSMLIYDNTFNYKKQKKI